MGVCVDVHVCVLGTPPPQSPASLDSLDGFLFVVVRSHTTLICVALTAPVWFAHAHKCVYIGITSSVVPPLGSLLFCGLW